MKPEQPATQTDQQPESVATSRSKELLDASWRQYQNWRIEARRLDEQLQEITAAFKHAEVRRNECWEIYRTLQNKNEASNS